MGSMHFFTAMPQATGQVSRSYFHKLLNFNDVTDIYHRQNRSRGDKLRRSLSRCWTNPAASKSQMKIKVSTKRAQQQQQQCTGQSLMLIGLLISSCFRMQIQCPEGQLSSWTFDGFVEVAMLNSDCPQRPLHPLSMPISRDPRGQMLRCCDSASSQSPLSIFRVRNPSRQSNVANQVCVSQPVRYGMWSSFQDAPCRKLAQTLLVPLMGHAAW